jgi:DNA polymerase I-like protein with 3'-5' exonuclease and polymerase domains
MAVLSMVEINRRFRAEGIKGHCIGLVHDAVNYEIREDSVADALPIIKDTMEDVSLIRRKFGTVIDVPIVADLKVGTRWGDATELEPHQVYDWDPSILTAA